MHAEDPRSPSQDVEAQIGELVELSTAFMDTMLTVVNELVRTQAELVTIVEEMNAELLELRPPEARDRQAAERIAAARSARERAAALAQHAAAIAGQAPAPER